jgi:hypothetical protein
MAALAASYCVGLAKNPPFVDGNERAAFLATGLFLHLNGYRLTATQAGVPGDAQDQNESNGMKPSIPIQPDLSPGWSYKGECEYADDMIQRYPECH